jgi:DNA-binding IclR family transcriptional regulator
VRRLGWAEDELSPDRAAGVAAPIRDPDGEVAAALCLFPPGRCGSGELRRHGPLAVAAAAQISDAMRRR